MKLKTIFEAKKSELSIDFNDSLFFLGSCFGENMSAIFSKRKFQTYSNPFGIVFNPISIFDNIENVLAKKIYTPYDLDLNNEIYSCFDFHSDLSGLSKERVLKQIESKTLETFNFLQKTTIVFLTFGTSWVYEYETDEKTTRIVANCHKFPSDKFKKRLLNVDEIVLKANHLISKLKEINKDIKIVFTISPVRHLKDGFIENNQSKAVLHLAVSEILKTQNNSFYFPAYEYVIDELRDYRFYGKDLVHPNDLAVEYVLEKFDATYINEELLSTIKKIESLNKSLEHKVKYRESEAHRQFQESLMKKMKELESLGFDFSEEKAKLFS